MWCQPAFQFILNLQSDSTSWRDLVELTGEVMNEREYLMHATAAHHPLLVLMALVFKTYLAYSFGFFELAEELCEAVHESGQVFMITSAAPNVLMLSSIISYERFRGTGRRKKLRAARRYKKPLERALLQGSPNASSHLSFLLAEDMSVRKNSSLSSVKSAYDQAIITMMADDQQGPNNLAWVNQRAGLELAERNGEVSEVNQYLDKAMALLRYGWRSPTMYQWLLEEREHVLGRLAVTGTGTNVTSNLPPVVGTFIQVHDELEL
jgi:hypothetical protein